MARADLAALGIRSPLDLAQVARSRGLLGVYIEFTPKSGPLPGRWQVKRPGHRTDALGPPWQQGHKTFVVLGGVAEKRATQQRAVVWAQTHFGVERWVQVEGLGAVLFPGPVVDELLALPG